MLPERNPSALQTLLLEFYLSNFPFVAGPKVLGHPSFPQMCKKLKLTFVSYLHPQHEKNSNVLYPFIHWFSGKIQNVVNQLDTWRHSTFTPIPISILLIMSHYHTPVELQHLLTRKGFTAGKK